jgi:16S rRNA (guanine966-N2)-methyltransferase
MAGRMRVIAGEARGMTLVAPPDARPTSGRVREAVFSSLGEVGGATVLDLFAGSGALAIEALSRGADRAVLVDRDRAAVDACRTNLETTRLAERARVVARPVGAVLAGPPPVEAPFDLVCCDPPYGLAEDVLGEVLDGLAAPGWVDAEARVVLERRTRRREQGGPPPDPAFGPAWSVRWERRYGDTLITVLRPLQAR